MRLDKFLSETNTCSRKDTKQLIKQGRIIVNGCKAFDPGMTIKETEDEVTLDGRIISYEKYVYYMLNKPSDVVSATTDKIDTTVIDLLASENRPGLFPVGRLDKDTVGLLIITDDGELGHRLTSPRHHATKTYFVRTKFFVTDESIKRLMEGVDIGEDEFTKEAIVERISDNEIELTITEGKFHQVKRMLNAVDNEVIYLKRLSMGGVNLDTNLKEGCYRRLTSEEIQQLKEI